MRKDIYDMLNDTTIDINTLDRENFNDLEKRTFIKNFKKSINKDKNRKRKTALVASLAAFMILGVGVSSEALADIQLKMFDIGNYLLTDKNLNDYKTVVNSSVTKNGITIQLNEVIIDNEELIVSSTIKSNLKLDEMGIVPLGDVYINAKMISFSSNSSGCYIDDYTYENVAVYHLDRKLPSKNFNVKINHTCAISNDTEIKGPWNFEFVANGKQLAINTIENNINYNFMLDNNQRITLNKHTKNDIGQKIYYSVKNRTKNYDLELRGVDDLGNEVVFYSSHEDSTNGVFKQNTKISDEAKTLTLTLYASLLPNEGSSITKETTLVDNCYNYKKIGEEFTININ